MPRRRVTLYEQQKSSPRSDPNKPKWQVGETLTLPCRVENLGAMVLLWKKGHRVLTAGNIHVRRDHRISLRGTDLQILSEFH